MKKIETESALEVAEKFEYEGRIEDIRPYGNGHINDTFLITCKGENHEEKKYILQRMNRDIFHKPVELIENIVNVTNFLKEKISEAGGDPVRETLTLLLTKEGCPLFVDQEGEYWRMYIFIVRATSYDQADDPRLFYESGMAFGRFQNMLWDFPAEKLHETIEGFHDTPRRFRAFEIAVREDVMNRVRDVQKEIDFVMARKDLSEVFDRMQKQGNLPLRVTHNDTKLNNIMIDDVTGQGICVIDLDTVMPGLVMNDFGDAIRFGASTAAEDEKNLSKVSCDMNLFEMFARGFVQGCEGRLTPAEMSLLPTGAMLMTYECGMRFLMDHLQGDIYFKIHREGHNLDRARTQLKLVEDMETKKIQMEEIVRKYM